MSCHFFKNGQTKGFRADIFRAKTFEAIAELGCRLIVNANEHSRHRAVNAKHL
ncbi:MAG: hypothetical protein JXR70_09440 [Spirochaetales bacterium]|nr:hypothetical protein [Spirochaetales bacterium]